MYSPLRQATRKYTFSGTTEKPGAKAPVFNFFSASKKRALHESMQGTFARIIQTFAREGYFAWERQQP